MGKISPLKTKLKSDEFYCVKCRKRQIGDKITLKIYNNNYKRKAIPMLKSKCPKCGTNMNKFTKK
jgi:hypothetical protein